MRTAVPSEPPTFRESDLGSKTPRSVGPYRVIEPIARGGFGIVYRAEHAETGALVALKIVHAELAADATVVSRFEREVEAIRRIDHPNVVRVLDTGRLDDGRPYFAMELLSGESLREHLDARGRLPVAEALAILEPLCGAVAAAHARAIIHRDIKASNVMLARDGERPRVVLLDFGVAKLLDDEGAKLTSSRHVVGTISCMSPEQILAKAVDERTDVYALGVLAYRVLTGEMPFAARSMLAMQQMHLSAVPRAPSAVAPLGPAFDAVLLRALAKDLGARQPTVTAFLDELRAAVAPRETPAPRPSPMIAVLVEVRFEASALDAPSERLLDDIASILPSAAAALSPLPLTAAMETGTSLLLAAPCPDDADADRALRRDVLAAVAALHTQLLARPGADPDVGIRTYVHTGGLTLNQAGIAIAGALLQLDAWVPDLDAAGPLVSREVMAGVALPARVSASPIDGWSVLEAR
ncbi:MAG: serine/threonine-protein kinase [Minicystis sp.]